MRGNLKYLTWKHCIWIICILIFVLGTWIIYGFKNASCSVEFIDKVSLEKTDYPLVLKSNNAKIPDVYFDKFVKKFPDEEYIAYAEQELFLDRYPNGIVDFEGNRLTSHSQFSFSLADGSGKYLTFYHNQIKGDDLVNLKGKLILRAKPGRNIYWADMSNQLACVVRDAGTTFEIIDFNEKIIKDFSEFKKCPIIKHNYFVIEDEKRPKFFNLKGDLVFDIAGIEESKLVSNELRAVKINHRWGFVNDSGKMIISNLYDSVNDFDAEGHAIIEDVSTGNQGLIDKTGKKIVSVKYRLLRKISSNALTAFIDDRCGIIDLKERVLIPFQYNYCYSNGPILFLSYEEGKHYFLKNAVGKFIPLYVDNLISINDQLFIGQKDNLVGVINRESRVLIPIKFEEIKFDEKNQYFVSYSTGKTNIYDVNGRAILQDVAGRYIDCHEGFCIFKGSKNIEIFYPIGNREYRSGNYESIHNFSEGLASVNLKGKWVFINKKEEIVIDNGFSSAENFRFGLALVKKENKFGFIDKNGMFTIKPQFDHANSFFHNVAVVGNEGKLGIIDRDGNYLIQPIFESIEDLESKMPTVEFRKLKGVMNLKNCIP